MPQRCRACTHPSAESINEALLGGQAMSRVARSFGVARSSLRRHHANHLPAMLLRQLASEPVVQSDSLADRFRRLITETRDIKARAETVGDLRTALHAVKEESRLLELVARADIGAEQSLSVDSIVDALVRRDPLGRLIVEALDRTVAHLTADGK